MPKQKLTELTVARAKSPKPGRRLELWDTTLPGFGLRIMPTGTRSYVVALRKPGSAHPVRVKVGEPPAMSLADARTKARALMQDPAAAVQERQQVDTVAAVAAEYGARHLKRNTRRWRDAEQMLARDVLPALGGRLIGTVTRRDVLDVVDAVIDRGSPVSANRVLSLVKRLFGWALQRGILEVNVAAGIKPPHREKPRERTLAEDEIRVLWQAWEQMGHPFGPLGKLLLLTGQRRGEIAGLRWDQIDLERGVMHLEGAATKTEREHVLPLAPAVVELLRTLPRIGNSPLVFPANRVRSANPVSGFSKALTTASRLSGVEGFTWHDLRRTAATHMAARGVAPHVCERILNHSGGSTMSAIARVYNVHSYGPEMRAALDDWAAEVRRIVHGADVVALRGRA